MVAEERRLLTQRTAVPGRVLEEVLVPARGFLRARRLEPGQVMRIVDVQGQQVADLIAFAAADCRDLLSCLHTKLLNGTWRITTGHTLYSKRCTPLLTITSDTVGRHWFGGGFCSPETNLFRYGVDGTVSCKHNLAAAFHAYGIAADELELDSCASLFMNLVEAPDGSFAIQPPPGKAGDHIDLRAEVPVVIGLSACPSERNPCNGYRPTPLKVIIYEPEPATGNGP